MEKSYVTFTLFSNPRLNTYIYSLFQSCELCNSRKVKCDRKKPSCGWCQRNNRKCTYTERKKPGVIGVDIEGRINNIEARLLVLAQRLDNHISDSHEIYKHRKALELPSTLYFYATDEPARGSPNSMMHGQDLNSPLFTQPLLDMTTESVFSCSPPSSFIYSTADLSEHHLPAHHLLCDLVSLFFKYILPWAPILDHETISTLLCGSYSALHEEDYVLLHAIVATTLRFSKDPALTSELRYRYHKISKQKVQVFALENSSIKALQALALVAVDVLGTSDGPEGRKLLVLLVRSIVQLDLHIEKSEFLSDNPSSTCLGYNGVVAPLKPPNSVEEGRRRLVWLVHMLDIEFASNEVSIDTPLPSGCDLPYGKGLSEAAWSSHMDCMEVTPTVVDDLESFTYHCKILRILARIHRFVQESVDIISPQHTHCWRTKYHQLDDELSDWLSSVPAQYGSISRLCGIDPAIKSSNWIMIHATYLVSIMRLHSTAAYPITQTHISLPCQNAMLRCLAATESLSMMTQFVVKTGALSLLGQPYAFALWASARLLLVHASAMQSDIDPSIWFLLKTLEQMGQYWDVAGHYAQTLKQVVCQEPENELENLSSPNLNYAAMRWYVMNRQYTFLD